MKKELYFLNLLILPDEKKSARIVFGYKTKKGFYDVEKEEFYNNEYLKFWGCEDYILNFNGSIEKKKEKNKDTKKVNFGNELKLIYEDGEKFFLGYRVKDGFYDIENEHYYSYSYLDSLDVPYKIVEISGFVLKKENNIKEVFSRVKTLFKR